MQSIGAGASDTLLIDDRTVVRTTAGSFATIANLGTAQTNLGTDTQVGNVWSVGPVVVRDRSRVSGFIRGRGAVTVAATASVNPGPVVANTSFAPLDSVSWTVTFPTSSGDVVLQPRATRTLAPGSYGAVAVQPTAKLTLTAGTYFFQSLDFESQATVSLDDRNGPISIYVANSVIYRAAVSDTANQPTNILLAFAGTAPVAIEAPFIGTFVAPSARVTVGSLSHRGAFFAKGLEILPGATLVAQAFSALPSLSLNPGQTVRVSQPVFLTLLTEPAGFTAPITYQWTVSSTPPGVRFHLDPHGNTAVLETIDPGDLTVSVTMSDPAGHRSTSSTPIHVLDLPLPQRPDRVDPFDPTRPCRDGDETLAEYSARCDRAMNGVTVPAFDCEDKQASDPNYQGKTTTDVKLPCEAPNVLNQECDPGSHFHVLHRGSDSGDGIYVVAHCRHKAFHDKNVDHQYGDVAVIQYNANTGATCFYQALQPRLPNMAPAPSSGDLTFWEPPSGVAGQRCVSCHDNGVFIRSPYLAQFGQVWPFLGDPNHPSTPAADKNYLPGTLLTELSGAWNHTLPYQFVGLNFQSWEAYSLTNTANPTCTGCHRMGVNQTTGTWNQLGSSIDLGMRATDTSQAEKFDHGALVLGKTSPIWMQPGDLVAKDATRAAAVSMHDCAVGVTKGNPPAGCSATLLARGDTCPAPTVVVNGATSAGDPTSWKNNGKLPLGQPGGRIGFYYFTSVHGPFYQNSPWDSYMNAPPAVGNPPWDPATNDQSFRGTYLRLYIEPSGQWMLAWGLDARDIQNSSNTPPPPGGPGGKVEAVAFDQIDSIPNPKNCGSNYFAISDHTGNTSPQSATVDTTWGTSAAILAGLIGNVSHESIVNGEGSLIAPSSLQVTENGGATTLLTQVHDNDPEGSVNQWFTGEAWGNSCANWRASDHYVVHNVPSYGDVALAPNADVASTICYIDGIGGDWSQWQSDGNGGSIQPYAQIYIDPTDGYHLKVSPSANNDPNRLVASATCLSLK